MDSIESEPQSESSQTSIKDEKDEVPAKPGPRRSTRKKLNKVGNFMYKKVHLLANYKRQNDPNGFAKTNTNG